MAAHAEDESHLPLDPPENPIVCMEVPGPPLWAQSVSVQCWVEKGGGGGLSLHRELTLLQVSLGITWLCRLLPLHPSTLLHPLKALVAQAHHSVSTGF